MTTKSNKPCNFRLTPEAKRILQAVADKFGVSKTAVVEMAIRKIAESERVK